jgi:hypothetical protein
MAKSKWIVNLIFDTALFGAIFFFSKFASIAFERRLLLSLLVGIGLGLAAGVARYLLKPSLDRWKIAIKKKRAEKGE